MPSASTYTAWSPSVSPFCASSGSSTRCASGERSDRHAPTVDRGCDHRRRRVRGRLSRLVLGLRAGESSMEMNQCLLCEQTMLAHEDLRELGNGMAHRECL